MLKLLIYKKTGLPCVIVNYLLFRIGLRMNGIWVQALLGPMHLGLKTGPLCQNWPETTTFNKYAANNCSDWRKSST